MKVSIGKVITGIGAVIAGVLLLVLSGNDKTKYSSSWFESASDDELEAEREKIRQEFCSSGGNISLASELQNLLRRFDAELSKRAWNGRTDYGYPKRREHGWYLPNDDD